MPRFVLLYHECPPGFARPSHWDLMFEAGEKLRTWALQQLPRDWHTAHLQSVAIDSRCPPIASDNIVAAESLADHRLDYLAYEGALSHDRGQVTRVASGTFRGKSESPDFWRVTLMGGLRGTITLQQSSPDHGSWSLTYVPGS
jgi:hypothetical protein